MTVNPGSHRDAILSASDFRRPQNSTPKTPSPLTLNRFPGSIKPIFSCGRAQVVQFRLGRSGHLWQGRYKATPMDDSYLWAALRYVELNPVRAGMASRPEQWAWSSAGAHLGVVHWPDLAGWTPLVGAVPFCKLAGGIKRPWRRGAGRTDSPDHAREPAFG